MGWTVKGYGMKGENLWGIVVFIDSVMLIKINSIRGL